MAQDSLEDESKKLKMLESAHNGWAQKLRVAQDLAAKNLNASQDVQEELDDFALKVQSLEQKMHEEAQKIITQHAIRTRVEMMLEYQRGEWSSWDVDETIRIYNEAYPNDAFSLFIPQSNKDGAKNAEDDDSGAK